MYKVSETHFSILVDIEFLFTIFKGASSAESAQVYVDLRALRNNRVALVERGAPNSLCLIESGITFALTSSIISLTLFHLRQTSTWSQSNNRKSRN